MKLSRFMVIGILYLAILFMSISYAGEIQQELPRGFGPLILGMSKAEIVSITGADFGRCVHCVEGEEEGDLVFGQNGAKISGKPSFDATKSMIPGQPEGIRPSAISCFVFQGRLYLINLRGVSGNPLEIRNNFVRIFDQPDYFKKMGAGITQIVWENPLTTMQIDSWSKSQGTAKEKSYLEILFFDNRIISNMPVSSE